MRTKNFLSRFRDALTFSTLFLVLPAVCPAQEADRSSAARGSTVGRWESVENCVRRTWQKWRGSLGVTDGRVVIPPLYNLALK